MPDHRAPVLWRPVARRDRSSARPLARDGRARGAGAPRLAAPIALRPIGIMNPERWRQITAVFHDALARPPASRAAFLDAACEGDPALREEVRALLGADQNAGQALAHAVLEPLGDSADPHGLFVGADSKTAD